MTYHRVPKNAYSVYFARAGRMMKIGCSTNVEQRLRQIGEWIPFEIELVAVVPGAFDLEADLHAYFADSWSHLEWFHITAKMEDYLAEVAAGRVPDVPKVPRNNGKELAKTLKKQATRRITMAEDRIYGWMTYPERRKVRPRYLTKAINSFAGPHNPPPDDKALAAIARFEREMERRAKRAGAA